MLKSTSAILLAAVAASVAIAAPVACSAAVTAAPRVQPAVDGILAAFASRRLVGITDMHGNAQEGAFYQDIISDPRFAREVGNVVVEFGGAAHQGIIDRYVAGEEVPYTELRRVWTDTVGWLPGGVAMTYVNFFARVRAINQTLPEGRRIKVWLGEPPIDWSKIKTRADIEPLLWNRIPHVAGVIRREILAKNKKALVIYGGAHFAGPLKHYLEESHPGSLFVVTVNGGYNEPRCNAELGKLMAAWPEPALAAPIRGSTLEAALKAPGCTRGKPGAITFIPRGSNVAPPSGLTMAPPPGATQTQAPLTPGSNPPAAGGPIRMAPPPGGGPGGPGGAPRMPMLSMDDLLAGTFGDALLYLGQPAGYTLAPVEPSIYLDPAYAREISRRNEIMTGRPLDLGKELDRNKRAIPFDDVADLARR